VGGFLFAFSVAPEMQALHNTNAKQLLVFHQNGLASYSAEHCGWLWEIFGDDILQYSKEKDMVSNVVYILCVVLVV